MLLRLTLLMSALWVLAVGYGALLNSGVWHTCRHGSEAAIAPSATEGGTCALPMTQQTLQAPSARHSSACRSFGHAGLPPQRGKLPFIWFDNILRGTGPLLPLPILLLRWYATLPPAGADATAGPAMLELLVHYALLVVQICSGAAQSSLYVCCMIVK